MVTRLIGWPVSCQLIYKILSGKTAQKNHQPKTRTGLIWMVAFGMVAGVCFNLAFGSVLWNAEGILGGLITGVLIYAIS